MGDREDGRESGVMSDAALPNNPFFIIGSGRSGTTLLRLMLAAHSRLTIPPETWFLIPLVEQLPHRDVLTSEQVEQAIDIITQHYRWPDLEIESDELARLARGLPEPTVRGVADLIYDRLAARDGAPRWGDKTPPYAKIAPEIVELYPDAQFIHLVRDGRDVSISMYRKRWWGRWLIENTSEWRESMGWMKRNREVLDSDRILEMRYEDLVLDTEGTARRVCEFLGEEFEPAMLAWQETVDQKVPGREMDIHQKLYKAPSRDDTYRWKRELAAPRVFMVEAYLREELIQEGYELRFDGPAWAMALKACRGVTPIVLPVIDIIVRIPPALWRRVKWGMGWEERPPDPE
jgi:hypothetical protein